MALNLDTLLNFYNGTALLEAGAQEWGYIDEAWYLAIPNTYNIAPEESRNYWRDLHPKVNPFIEHPLFTKGDFLKANYARIFAATQNQEQALFGAILRMAFVESGMFCTDIGERHITVDEYIIVPPLGASWADPLNNIPNIASANAMAQWIKRFSMTVASQLVFIFCARGHHYTAELNEHYRRLQEACFMTATPGFVLPSNEFLYRSFIHCFGMFPMRVIVDYLITTSKIPSAMTIRFTPHPPIAGCAHITTLYAIIKSMEKEMLWKQVKPKFASSLQILENEINRINESPYSYHVSARILAGTARTPVSNDAMNAFSELSQIALGYLEYLGNRNSLYRQRAVTAKSGGLGPTAETWETAFTNYGVPDIKNLTPEEFVMEMFPTDDSMNQKIQRVVHRRNVVVRSERLTLRREELLVAEKEQQMEAAGFRLPNE